jgi:hypothetical protein
MFQHVCLFLALICTYPAYRFGLGCCLLLWYYYALLICTSYYTYNRQIEEAKRVYAERRDALSEYGKSLRDGWVGKGAVAMLGIAAVVFAIRAWNKWRMDRRKGPEGFVVDGVGIAEEDDKPSWMHQFMDRLYMRVKPPESSKYASPTQVVSGIGRNLCWGEFQVSEEKRNKCGVFFPRKSVMLFPQHIVHPGGDMTQEMVKSLCHCHSKTHP